MNIVIPQDKANHFIYGAVLASAGALYSHEAGAALCLVVAVGKEVYDRVSRKGTPEVADAVATVIGGAVVLLPQALPLVVALFV